MAASRAERLTLAAFLASIVLAGGNAIGVRLTVAELPPFWGATLRFALAGSLLVLFMLVRRIPLPRGERLLGSILFGTFSFGLSFMFLYWALQDVPAGTAQVVLSIVPLLTLFLAVAHGVEPFRVRGLAGALVAGVGVVVIFIQQADLSVPIPSLLAILAGAACFGEGSVLAKRFPPGNPVAANAVAMLCGAAVLGVLTLVTGEPITAPTRGDTWIAVGYLVVFGSIVVFVLTLHVLDRWTASATSYSFLLIPLVTVVVAAVLLHEPVQPTFLAGGALVLAGVYLGAFYRPGRLRAASSAGASGAGRSTVDLAISSRSAAQASASSPRPE